MKANELSCKDLMVGDWVRIKITQHNTKVTNIDANSVYTEAAFPIRYDEIEPIPLTPEIFEKNGWVYIAEDKVFYSEKLKRELPWIYYITDGSNEVFRMQDFCNLQYVHQLQHALRLCGIEKEIVL